MRIGYYVHHHGRGHATRAGVIGAQLARRGHAVTYLGSGVLPAGDRVVLASDADDADEPFVDPDAGGRLHWAPLGGGYAERSAQIAAWVTQARPDVVVVDVSVEVTALVRLLGVPVVVVGQPGRRDDDPHALAFGLAAAVLAPWSDGLDVAPHLERLGEKVVRVGGVSRFAGSRPGLNSVGDGSACPVPSDSGSASPGPSWGDSPSLGTHGDAAKMAGGAAAGGPVKASPNAASRGVADSSRPLGVLLVGGEGWDDAGLPDAVVRAVPEVAWHAPDAENPVETLLAEADVVVTHAGQNALADVAAFGVPAVVVPQERPFDEQADMARALEAAGIAHGLALGASAGDVAAAVREMLAGDDERSTGRAWARWRVDGAAERAADVIEGAARGDVVERGADEAGCAARGVVDDGVDGPAATGGEAPALGDGEAQ